jgi:protein-tyrosine-phosphatase/predicted ATP-grasp superfamily ATP-dependent carboligase
MSASAGADRILVLDGDQASALSIVRSLARSGLVVDVASASEAPICGHSRHVRRCERYPDPLSEPDRFVDWIRARIDADSPALVIPVTERTLVPLHHQRANLDLSRIAMAPEQALDQVLDKARTVALAEKLGIAVPRSHMIETLDELDDIAAGIGYPMVVKPSRSVGGAAQGRVQLSVSYAHDRAELEKQVRHALAHGSVILQEYFRAQGVGIELIADHGEIGFAFQHRRLHEVPLTGGGSSLRCSEPIVPALLDAAQALMRALGWHGVAMVEFKYAPDTGQFRLMEINGRFWGSLPLAIAAGADFPRMLYELLCQGKIAPRPPARPGVVCRQLARDVDWLEHVLRKHAPPALVTLPGWRDILRDCALVFSPRHHFDVQSLSDPKPGLVDIGRIVARQFARVSERYTTRRRLDAQRRRAQTLTEQPCRSILFLCYGNINRSALAHAYALQLGAHNLAVASSGFHPQADRPADPVMVTVAGRHGVDLASWRSHALDAQQVEQADLILAMELAHIDRLNAQYPGAADKTHLLGALTPANGGEIEISDPYGQAPEVYETVCLRVIRSVDAWLAKLSRAQTAPSRELP